jgi:ADP-ribose pyrophosphatase
MTEMNTLSTHPSYPKRYDINEDDYEEKTPFYEHESLKDFEGVWSDYKEVSYDELKNRLVWYYNNCDDPKLITLEEAGIEFKNDKPVTPFRTGIKGRGMLGKYGPNHAADPIVTCWIDDKLHFVGVLRNDTGEWAIPGGMVDPGEHAPGALRREFKEEACSEEDDKIMEEIFKNGDVIFAGPTYEDPRTTDNAWIETYVVHFHIDEELAKKIKFTPQKDEVSKVAWVNCDEKLYGGHSKFINIVKEKMYFENNNELTEYIDYDSFNTIYKVFVFLILVIILVYYTLKLQIDIKNEEKYIQMFLCDYDNCTLLLFSNVE